MTIRLISGVIFCLLFGPEECWADSRQGSAGAGRSPSVFVQTTKVKNRARSLAGELSGSATRYWAVTDVDLEDLSSRAEKLARLLPPPVTAGNGIRRYEVVVDTRNPLFFDLARHEVARVGTVEVQRGSARVEVITIIDNAVIYSNSKKNSHAASMKRIALAGALNDFR